MNKQIAFLGAGNMATPIINSITNHTIFIYDKFKEVYKKFNADNINCVDSTAEAVNNADYVFLGSKPQNIAESLTEVKTTSSFDGKVFVSIAAGVSISRICELLEKNVPVIRTMPNTPMIIGKGVTVITSNEFVNDTDFTFICDIFKKTSEVLSVPEEHINTFTSVTASAPAYVYLFIKAIHDSAVQQGLDYENMLRIICDMVSGSADLLSHTGMSPDEMIKIVASPNGTTEAALKVFGNSDFLDIIHNAMTSCTNRAVELSELN